MNVLFVGAHHDDLEVSSGGSVKRWVEEGCNVFSAILTDSTWTGPDGICFRDPQQVESHCQKAARLLGYTQISLNYGPCFTLVYSDEKVTDLYIISQHRIDMLVTISPSMPTGTIG